MRSSSFASLLVVLPFAAGPLLSACGSSPSAATAASSGASSSSSSSSSTSSSTSGGGAGGSGGAGGAPDTTIDLVISKSLDSSSEHEPQLVVTSAGRVVVSYAERNESLTNYFHIGYRVSNDRGATWNEPGSIKLPMGSNIAANATLSADAAGDVYLAYGTEQKGANGVRSNQAVYLAKLDAKAQSFAEPTLMTDPAAMVGVYDQPAIFVTPAQSLLLTWGQGSADLQSIWLVSKLSTDAGKTWQTNVPLMDEGPQTYENLAHACAPSKGNRVYLYDLDAYVGLTLWRSDDGGATFAKDARTAVQAASENNTFSTMLDGNCVADGDEVWAVYGLTDQLSGDGSSVPRLVHVRLAHSGDGGKTIDWRASIDDAKAGKYFLLPRIAREASGAIDVTYYAGSGEGDKLASYRRARSSDGGKTFAPSTSLHAPITYELSRTTAAWFGDYMGVMAEGGDVFSAFIDNASGASHVVFHREPAVK